MKQNGVDDGPLPGNTRPSRSNIWQRISTRALLVPILFMGVANVYWYMTLVSSKGVLVTVTVEDSPVEVDNTPNFSEIILSPETHDEEDPNISLRQEILVDRTATPTLNVTSAAITLRNISSTDGMESSDINLENDSRQEPSLGDNNTTTNHVATISIEKKSKKSMTFAGHFLSHIPKVGTSYALNAINSVIADHPDFRELPQNERFRACNEAQKPIRKYYKFRKEFKGRPCTMWMSEIGWHRTIIPEYTEIILRDPMQHVLSQYFHCAESSDHRELRYRMPTLDVWLDAWVQAISNTTQVDSNREFGCSNPLNFQTRWMKVNTTDLKNNQDRVKQDLLSRYEVIGINAYMGKSVCLIAIRYAGFVPRLCDCTASEKRVDRRLLEVKKYDRDIHSHGVTHHGSTYQTNKAEGEAIAKIIELDQIVYDISLEVFAEQLRQTEEAYQIQICDSFRTVPNVTLSNTTNSSPP